MKSTNKNGRMSRKHQINGPKHITAKLENNNNNKTGWSGVIQPELTF